MAALFDLVGEFNKLYELATADDVDPEVFADTLEALTGELEVKASGYVAVIERLQMEADKADEISKRYGDLKKSREDAIKRMKDRLKLAMQEIGKSEIAAGDFTVKLKNNGGAQPLKITGDVPDAYKKVEISDDNTKIREYLKTLDGNKCEWAYLAERGQHVEIK